MTEDTPAEILRARLRRDLRAAMKAQRRDEMAALRNLIAAIDNAESVDDATPPPRASGAHVAGALPGLGAAEAARRSVSERDLQRIIESELWERDAQAQKFELLGRVDDATRLRVESEIIARYRTSDD
jgi:uncharacterized protein YqeY